MKTASEIHDMNEPDEPLQTMKALNKAQEILNELEALMQQRSALECAYREAVKPLDTKISAARCALAMGMDLAIAGLQNRVDQLRDAITAESVNLKSDL